MDFDNIEIVLQIRAEAYTLRFTASKDDDELDWKAEFFVLDDSVPTYTSSEVNIFRNASQAYDNLVLLVNNQHNTIHLELLTEMYGRLKHNSSLPWR